MLQDPKVYVHALLDIRNKYSAMVQTSFSGDPGFIQSLGKVSVHTCRALSFGKGSIVEMALYVQGKSCLPSPFAMLQFVGTA